jgi:NAD(P)-dependent dehydrogenase (short-subunit alcohol dehydrogenase family)
MAAINPDGVLKGHVEEADHYLPGTITATVENIKAAGGDAIAVRADLAQAADRRNLIETATDAYGPVDILVNNAAVTYYIPTADFPEKRFRLMMDLQVWAPLELAQLVLPGMRERGGGWILNISSHSAIHPDKTLEGRGGTVYGMCKAALERFSTGLAQELFDENIGVNVISPGLVATPGAVHHNLINDSNRNIVTPVEHMAEACLRLVHGDPKEITGRIDYANQVIEEFDLQPADLI